MHAHTHAHAHTRTSGPRAPSWDSSCTGPTPRAHLQVCCHPPGGVIPDSTVTTTSLSRIPKSKGHGVLSLTLRAVPGCGHSGPPVHLGAGGMVASSWVDEGLDSVRNTRSRAQGEPRTQGPALHLHLPPLLTEVGLSFCGFLGMQPSHGAVDFLVARPCPVGSRM